MHVASKFIGGIAAIMMAVAASGAVQAGDKALRIGVLTDLSSFASTAMGQGSVVATQLAVKDFGGQVLGKPIEVISADMQSKPDLAATLAQRWYDVDGVDVIVDVPASAGAHTDEQIEQFIRSHADTIYHPVGTCRMGGDSLAVVDAELRVHGLQGLRVVDASIMPRVVGGNTNAPTIMIAEKAADLIKAAARAA